MPYTSGIGFRSWHADHPSFKRLGAGTPSRFALVFTSAIERVPKQNRPILSRACPRVSERILAKKRVSEFPNITYAQLWTVSNTPGIPESLGDGAIRWSVDTTKDVGIAEKKSGLNGALYDPRFDASLSNSVYGSANTVQPASVRVLALIRAF